MTIDRITGGRIQRRMLWREPMLRGNGSFWQRNPGSGAPGFSDGRWSRTRPLRRWRRGSRLRRRNRIASRSVLLTGLDIRDRRQFSDLTPRGVGDVNSSVVEQEASRAVKFDA